MKERSILAEIINNVQKMFIEKHLCHCGMIIATREPFILKGQDAKQHFDLLHSVFCIIFFHYYKQKWNIWKPTVPP